MWTDKKRRAAFEAHALERLQALLPELEGKTGVVALEPESGDHFFGETLGQANAAAYAVYPDEWLYFIRAENPDAAIALATW
jgi:hypothetical protein